MFSLAGKEKPLTCTILAPAKSSKLEGLDEIVVETVSSDKQDTVQLGNELLRPKF